MEPGTGGEKPRSGRVTRSVYDAIAWGRTCPISGQIQIIKKKKHQSREWHVECERSDVRGVLWCMRSILHVSDPSHAWDSWKQARISAVSACGHHKSPQDFLMRSFMASHMSMNQTHETITISQHHERCVTTHYSKSDDSKKKFIMMMYDHGWLMMNIWKKKKLTTWWRRRWDHSIEKKVYDKKKNL
jgi:hypothetical protein